MTGRTPPTPPIPAPGSGLPSRRAERVGRAAADFQLRPAKAKPEPEWGCPKGVLGERCGGAATALEQNRGSSVCVRSCKVSNSSGRTLARSLSSSSRHFGQAAAPAPRAPVAPPCRGSLSPFRRFVLGRGRGPPQPNLGGLSESPGPYRFPRREQERGWSSFGVCTGEHIFVLLFCSCF